jgi:ADP-heptose:LPS heptosyltransferase
MKSPRRVLIIAEGQLGDLVLLTPAVRALRESFPEVRTTALVVQRRRYGSSGNLLVSVNARSGTAAVLMPYVDEIFEVDRTLLRALGVVPRLLAELSLLRMIRRIRCDTVLCTFPQDRFVLWAFLSGARRRVGQKAQPLRFLLTHRPAIRKEEVGVLRYYGILAEAAGAAPRSLRTEVSISEEHRRRAAAELAARGLPTGHPLLAIHPGASGGFNVWPPERFAALADGVRDGDLADVILCGSPYDRETVGAVIQSLRRPAPVIEFGDDVIELAALLERCRVVVTNNSGPWHLAQAAGAATVVFISHFRAGAWHVYRDNPGCVVLEGMGGCPVCPEGVCRDIVPSGERFGTVCLRMIGVEEALAAVRRLLTTP